MISFVNETSKMSGEETGNDAEQATEPPENTIEENSKQSFRKQAWAYLEKNRLVSFPRPAFGRIPNFKGAAKAAAKLLELEEFKVAKTVEVNPDKSLESSRILVVEYDKILYVPVPQLQQGFLTKISFCNEDKPKNLKQIVTRWGIETLGKSVDFEDGLYIDVLILGSVAVFKDGYRIGKGKGYADLEYAILKELKAVDDNTTIITTVHDSQVFECAPRDMFQKHDVPLDYILTPTQIIKVERKLPRPEGIYWNLLTKKRLNLMPILQKLKETQASQGKDTTLKEEGDSDIEYEERRKSSKPRKPPQQRPKSDKVIVEKNIKETTNYERPRRARTFRGTRSAPVTKENEDPDNKENDVVPRARKTSKQFRRNIRKLQVDFSLVVGNIHKDVRVRQLKDALIDHGIKPTNITWRGYKGFCYLHYVKPLKKEETDNEQTAFAVDNVIEILQTLKLNPESANSLTVKVMEPITRIETTDVTAV